MNNETHVEFCIFNFSESIEKITKIMGCTPTKAWLKGGQYSENNPDAKANHSRWCLSSGLELNSSFEEQLESLLAILEKQKENLKHILKYYESGIVMAAYFNEINSGFALSSESINRMSSLGVDIDFDLYCLNESK